MEPINYNLQPLNIIGSYAQGLQSGQVAQQNDLKLKAQQLAAEQAAQQQSEMDAIKAVATNPKATPMELASAGKRMLFLNQPMAASLTNLAKTAKQEELDTLKNHLHKNWFAITNGNIDAAIQQNDEMAAALENSGDKEGADAVRSLNKKIQANPTGAGIEVASQLIGLGDEKFISSMTPDAKTASEVAKNQAQTQKYLSDMEVNKLKAQNDAIRLQMQNVTDQTKLGVMQQKLAMNEKAISDTEKQKSADMTQSMNTLNQMDANITELIGGTDEKGNKIEPSVDFAGVVGSTQGNLPKGAFFLNQAGTDAIAKIDAIKAQAFAIQAALNRGQGALSDAEGKALTAALGNLDRAQSEEAFRKSLEGIRAIISKKRDVINKKYGEKTSQNDLDSRANALGIE